MIVRIDIEGSRAGFYAYRVSYESEELYGDDGILAMGELDMLAERVHVSVQPDARVLWRDASIRLHGGCLHHGEAWL